MISSCENLVYNKIGKINIALMMGNTPFISLISQGVVGGVMIVTPNNIMFDPHKSDPLVIEHGCEEYGLICPMEEVLSVALYDDVSRMQLKDALPS